VTKSFSQLEAHLRDAKLLATFVPLTHGGGGHGQKFAAVLEGGVTIFVKPESGVVDGMTVIRNEVAAWEVAKLLGWTDMLATTVLRRLVSPFSGVDETVAAQMIWHSPAPQPDIGSLDQGEVWRAAIFDYLIQHGDRGGANWLGVGGQPAAAPAGPYGPQRMALKLIDHGFSFGFQNRVLTSRFYSAHQGQAIPAELLQGVEQLIADASASSLVALLSGQSLTGLIDRAAGILFTKTLT
jgi:hypothetical protein